MSVKRSSGSQGIDRLHARRQLRRRRALFAFGILCVVLIGAAVWGLWQPVVRIARVDVSGTNVPLAPLAAPALSGSYLGIIPRDSIFFFPAESVRARILAAEPTLASLSIERDGFRAIRIVANPRVPLATWCGATYDALASPHTNFPTGTDDIGSQATSSTATSNASTQKVGVGASTTSATSCSVFDAGGFVYASAASSTPVLPFLLYAPLVNGATTTPAYLAQADALPATFDFARQAGSHGSPVVSIVIRASAGEVDDYLASGTRLTYVLGQEAEALAALASASQSASLNLSDGSIAYVDLRFPGKVYVKKVGSTQ